MRPDFNVVMVVPTGIGATIGGHSGDATPAARLLAGACDTLILHPNVVNASDLNHMPENSLYVEGSALDRFLEGDIALVPVRQNKILVVCNEYNDLTRDAVNAARSVIGVDAKVLALDTPLTMRSAIIDGVAGGSITGVVELVNQVASLDFDALAIHTPVEIEPDVIKAYMENGGINPWGGVEALLSRGLGEALGMPAAHAPLEVYDPKAPASTNPALAPEMICGSHLVSVLRGLHQAPQLRRRIAGGWDSYCVRDVDTMVSPMCFGRPHRACHDADIPIIFVEENLTVHAEFAYMQMNLRKDIVVENYEEAAGVLVAMRVGVSLESLHRPLPPVQ